MDESLKEARSTYRALVYLCGLYVLSLVCIIAKGGDNATISFWGIPLPGVGMLTFVIALGFVFLNLKLAAQLNHIRLILPFGEDEYLAVKHSPWELFSRGWRLSTCVKYVEFLVIFLALGLLTERVSEASRLIAACYFLVNLGIFYYSTIQLWLFRINLRSYERINHLPGDPRFYEPGHDCPDESWTAGQHDSRGGPSDDIADDLSDEEKYLLLSVGKDGNIFVLSTDQTGKWVETGTEKFREVTTPGYAAKYRDALDTLIDRQLVRHKSGAHYSLTGSGWDLKTSLARTLTNT